MTKKIMYKLHLLTIFLILFLFTGCATQKRLNWNEIIEPTKNTPHIYGGYTKGCLDGAIALNAVSDNYQAMRISRKRYFGHPVLISFLTDYSQQVNTRGYGQLAIGDLSQARGGPMPGGHASHQVGLDADIWFKRLTKDEKNHLTLYDVDNMTAVSVVNEDTITLNKNTWLETNADVLKIAAESPKVERIFVNYVVKKELCETHAGEKWLSKIRPWWGHQYHYHVRLACPENSPVCKSQAAVEDNDGCNETLNWWFSEEAKMKLLESSKQVRKVKPKKLPKQCDTVFDY